MTAGTHCRFSLVITDINIQSMNMSEKSYTDVLVELLHSRGKKSKRKFHFTLFLCDDFI